MTDVFDSLWRAPMSNRGTISFDSRHSTATLVGLDCGKVSAVSIKSNADLGGYVVVLHIAGSHYFRGRGQQGYAGAEYLTILMEGEPRAFGAGQASYRYVELSKGVEAKSSDAIRTTQTSLVIERLQKDMST